MLLLNPETNVGVDLQNRKKKGTLAFEYENKTETYNAWKVPWPSSPEVAEPQQYRLPTLLSVHVW